MAPANLDGVASSGNIGNTFWTGCDYVLMDRNFAPDALPDRVYHDYRFNLESNTWTPMPEFRSTTNRTPDWAWAGDQVVGWGTYSATRLAFE
jgi:hypothetical protein